MKPILAFALLLLSSTSRADYYLETAITFHLIDWAQTHEISRDPNMYESNIVLGKHPSPKAVNLWFASTLAAIPILHHYAPKWAKKIVSVSWLANGATSVFNNYQIGVRIEI